MSIPGMTPRTIKNMPIAVTLIAARVVPQRLNFPRTAEEKTPTASNAPAVPSPKAAMVAAPQRGDPVATARTNAA